MMTRQDSPAPIPVPERILRHSVLCAYVSTAIFLFGIPTVYVLDAFKLPEIVSEFLLCGFFASGLLAAWGMISGILGMILVRDHRQVVRGFAGNGSVLIVYLIIAPVVYRSYFG